MHASVTMAESGMQASNHPARAALAASDTLVAYPIRIMIANGYRLFGEALAELLTTVPGFAVVGHASDRESTFLLARQTLPAIVLLDLETSRGPEHILRQLRQLAPAPRVIILGAGANPSFAKQMLALGAHGYLHKAVGREDLVLAIYQIADSRRTVTLVDSPPESPDAGGEPLTEREREVLALVAGALSNRQIATKLKITEGTVKRHLRNIFGKLGAVSRIDAVNKAGISLAEQSDIRQGTARTSNIA
jgi:two-component system, NarL family, nitrate/nitrite response regulator NarL